MKGLIKLQKWDEAEALGEKVKDIFTATQGEESREVASVLNQLGAIKYYLDQYERAIWFYEKSLTIRLRVFGPQHLDVANSYSNIGNAYFFIGGYEKALEFHKKALEIRLSLSGLENIKLTVP